MENILILHEQHPAWVPLWTLCTVPFFTFLPSCYLFLFISSWFLLCRILFFCFFGYLFYCSLLLSLCKLLSLGHFHKFCSSYYPTMSVITGLIAALFNLFRNLVLWFFWNLTFVLVFCRLISTSWISFLDIVNFSIFL